MSAAVRQAHGGVGGVGLEGGAGVG
jgi:hypothetical protein